MASQALDRKLTTLTAWVTAGICFMVVFAVSVAGLLYWGAARQAAQSEKIKAVAVETHDSLCALKIDLRSRYDSSSKILKEHPEDPVTVFGLTIPRDQLVQSNQSQKDTLDSLTVLDCG